jgi:clan AA aspartic protease (TIGR02281 family)
MAGWKTGLALLVAGGAFAAGAIVGQRRGAPPSPVESGPQVRADLEGDPLTRAWQQVIGHPRDASAWLLLGDLESEHDEAEAAEHSYRTAVSLLSSSSAQAFARLGFFLYGRGDDTSALPLLVEAKRRGSQDRMLDFTIRAISSRNPQPKPAEAQEEDAGNAPAVDSGSTSPNPIDAGASESSPDCTLQVTRTRAGGAYLAEAQLNATPAHLLIDTGATVSVLNRELIQQLGASEDPRPMRVFTASGKTTMTRANIQSFGIGGRTAQNVMVGVCDDCVHGIADGLLGLDLQAMLGIQLELGASRIRFADCDR